MTVERIGPLDPIQNIKKAEKNTRPKRSEGTDTISLSAEAKSKAEIYNATELAKSASDIRRERVEEVKRKLQDPSYISEKVISDVAEKIMEFFELS